MRFLRYSVIFLRFIINMSSYWVHDLESFVGQCTIRLVNLLRAAVIFSNKHPTITPVNCICRDQSGKIGTKIRDQITIV